MAHSITQRHNKIKSNNKQQPRLLSTALLAEAHLVGSQDSEGVDDLLGRVHVGRLPRHEIQEAVELHVAARVRVHDRHDPLEVDLALNEKSISQLITQEEPSK